MPHIPRMAPTSGAGSFFHGQPAPTVGSTTQAGTGAAPTPAEDDRPPGLKRVSLAAYRVPTATVAALLFGEQPVIDTATGALMLPPRAFELNPPLRTAAPTRSATP
jgi:hypothetical protein